MYNEGLNTDKYKLSLASPFGSLLRADVLHGYIFSIEGPVLLPSYSDVFA